MRWTRLSAWHVATALAICGLLTFTSQSLEAERGKEQLQAKFRAATVRAVPNLYVVTLTEAAAGQPGATSKADLVAHDIKRAYFISRVLNVTKKRANRFHAEMPEAIAKLVALDGRVQFVEQETWGRALTTQYPAPWALDRLDQQNGGGALDEQFTYQTTGNGVDVYVVDTLMRTTHEEFDDRASYTGINWAPAPGTPCDPQDPDCGQPPPPSGLLSSDFCAHGTSMAGVIGGRWHGVAKDVRLLEVRVVNCENVVLAGLAANAIDDVVDLVQQSGRPSIINMSWNAGASSTLDASIVAAMNAGITVVAAAGNHGANSAPANYSPQRVPGIILVGATNSADQRWTQPGYESAFGAMLSLFAPGHELYTADWTADDLYHPVSGTSPASAVVSGVAALYLESDPNAGHYAVRDALVNNAVQGVVLNAGTGSPNRLVNSQFIGGVPPPPPPPPPPPGGAVEHLANLEADNGQFMVAEGGGGDVVNANRNGAGPWETFTMVDLNGGDLWDGDLVGFRSEAGHYLQALGGGGGGFEAIGAALGPWETFVVRSESGSDSRIDSGEWLALEASTGHYVVAEGGGGDIVNANRTAVGAWERFRLWFW